LIAAITPNSYAQDVEQNHFNKYFSRQEIDGQPADSGVARCARQPGFQYGWKTSALKTRSWIRARTDGIFI
jgi:hypothetical protein